MCVCVCVCVCVCALGGHFFRGGAGEGWCPSEKRCLTSIGRLDAGPDTDTDTARKHHQPNCYQSVAAPVSKGKLTSPSPTQLLPVCSPRRLLFHSITRSDKSSRCFIFVPSSEATSHHGLSVPSSEVTSHHVIRSDKAPCVSVPSSEASCHYGHDKGGK